MENPMTVDDLEVPLFEETSKSAMSGVIDPDGLIIFTFSVLMAAQIYRFRSAPAAFFERLRGFGLWAINGFIPSFSAKSTKKSMPKCSKTMTFIGKHHLRSCD